VHVDLNRIQVIHDWLALMTLKYLCNFLGLTKFYYRSLLQLYHITWPLSQETKGGSKSKFGWSGSQQKELQDLKHHLYSTLVLMFPYLQKPFDIDIDSSNYAIGVVLT
jgi:hypothetical protein